MSIFPILEKVSQGTMRYEVPFISNRPLPKGMMGSKISTSRWDSFNVALLWSLPFVLPPISFLLASFQIALIRWARPPTYRARPSRRPSCSSLSACALESRACSCLELLCGFVLSWFHNSLANEFNLATLPKWPARESSI